MIIAVAPHAAQYVIVETLDALTTESQRLESLYQKKEAALSALKKSLLHHSFIGNLHQKLVLLDICQRHEVGLNR